MLYVLDTHTFIVYKEVYDSHRRFVMLSIVKDILKQTLYATVRVVVVCLVGLAVIVAF